jgi:aminocarboxymuconate-semialdehyde decarboxylase
MPCAARAVPAVTHVAMSQSNALDSPDLMVDIHAHFVAPDLIAEARRNPSSYHLQVVDGADGSAHLLFDNGLRIRPFFPRLCDVAVRLAEMDADGVDVEVVSTWMDVVGYWLSGPAAVRWHRLQNDTLADLARHHPHRFRAIGTVPLQDPAAAAEEVDYIASHLGLRGLQVAANFGGRELDDPDLDRVWARVQEHGLFIFLHPHLHLPPPRLDRYLLANLIGNPLDTTIGFASLVFGGVLDRFPELKFGLAHGGGNVPYQIGRFDRGYEAHPDCRVHELSGPPSTYLSRFYFDTIVFDPARLAFLADSVGTDHLLFGTDRPFPLGDPSALQRLRATPGIDRDGMRKILGRNALSLLGE